MTNYKDKLRDILSLSVKESASDVHFSEGHKPILRIDRKLVPLEKFEILTSDDTKGFSDALLDERQEGKLETERTVEFSYKFEKRARFRTSVFYQRGSISIAMRLIPALIQSIEELNLPSTLHRFAEASQGFVLVTGPSSHGKTTTLASIVEEINANRSEHIITIEDPIEYYFEDKESIVDQREFGNDTHSFAKALRDSFRQDPDVIMVGEMRDKETISTALTAAETGHLVFSTLHTNSAAEAIHRIVDTFQAEQQAQVRAQLSSALLGVVAQRLVPRIRGGLIPACEILLANSAVSNLIRENKIHEIPMVIETSGEEGMVTLDKALANLTRAKEVSFQTAIKHSPKPNQFRKMVEVF